MLEIKNLNLSFGEQIIFKDTSLTLKDNGLYLLLGRNGIGKSTLFNILEGKIKTEASITYNGNKINNELVFVSSENMVFLNLTINEHLHMFSKDEAKINYLMEALGLNYLKRNKKTKKMSQGERQRLALVVAILEDKPIMLLDEATSHLDLENGQKVIKLLHEYAKDKIIILSTHQHDKLDYKPNYVININNYKLDVIEKVPTNIPNLPVKNEYYNFKTLFKLLTYKPKFIFMIILGVLMSITITFYTGITLDKYTGYEAYLKQEDTYYYLTEFNSNLPISKEESSKFNPDGTYYLNGNLFSLGELLKEDGSVITLPRDYYNNAINYFYITDNYNGKKLNDNEIIVSDYMNKYFKDNQLYFDGLTLNYHNLHLRVKGYFNTNYQKYEEEQKIYNFLKSEVMNRMYLNLNTYNNLKEAYLNDMTTSDKVICSNTYYLKDEYNDYNVFVGDDNLINDNDVILSVGYLNLYQVAPPTIPIEVPIYLTFTDTRYERTPTFDDPSTTYVKMFGNMFNVVGVTDDSSPYIIFKNKDALKTLFGNSLEDMSFDYFSSDSLDTDKVRNIIDGNYLLSSIYNDDYVNMLDDMDMLKTFFKMVFNLTLVIEILFTMFTYFLENKSKDNVLKLAKEKSFNKKTYNLIYICFRFLSFIFLIVSLVVSYYYLTPYINKIVNLLIGSSPNFITDNYLHFILVLLIYLGIVLVLYLFDKGFKIFKNKLSIRLN